VPFSNEEVPQLTHEMLPPKEECEALFNEHLRPDLDSYAPPKVDKLMSEFLGKCLPKEHDTELAKIQSAVQASIHPLTCARQHLIELGWARRLPRHDSTRIRGVSTVTVHKVHNWKCLKILETTDPSWGKFGSDGFLQPETHYLVRISNLPSHPR